MNGFLEESILMIEKIEKGSEDFLFSLKVMTSLMNNQSKRLSNIASF